MEPDASAVAPGPGCRGMLGKSPRRASQSVAAACTCGLMTRRCITGGCAPYRTPCEQAPFKTTNAELHHVLKSAFVSTVCKRKRY